MECKGRLQVTAIGFVSDPKVSTPTPMLDLRFVHGNGNAHRDDSRKP